MALVVGLAGLGGRVARAAGMVGTVEREETPEEAVKPAGWAEGQASRSTSRS